MQGVSRVLYRELLRSSRRIDRLSNEYAMPQIMRSLARLQLKSTTGFSDAFQTSSSVPQLSQLVSTAFRTPPEKTEYAIDDAFTALRITNEIVAWLRVNHRLHTLRENGDDVVAGAVVIADECWRDGSNEQEGPSCAEHVASELDAIADAVRTSIANDPATAIGPDGDAAGRLRTLQHINSILYDTLGYHGAYGDIEASSSISQALARRRGLPITLAAIYHGVASRLGLPVQFTNFPAHVLLRLEQDAEVADATTAAAEAAVERGGMPLCARQIGGLFVANYGPHGPEIVDVRLASSDRGGESQLIATKLTGDAHVPAGQRSWAATLAARATSTAGEAAALPALDPGTKLDARVQVAGEGFTDPHDVSASVEVRSADTLVLTMAAGDAAAKSDAATVAAMATATVTAKPDAAQTLLFRRCSPAQLWLVDAFSQGKLVPPELCRHALSRVGMEPETHGDSLAAVPPCRTWARFCRNLAFHARREGLQARADFWEGVGAGLDEAASGEAQEQAGESLLSL